MLDHWLRPADLSTEGFDEMPRFRLDDVGLTASDHNEIARVGVGVRSVVGTQASLEVADPLL